MTYVKRGISGRQYAWFVNKRLFTSHQRLNEEHLKDKQQSSNSWKPKAGRARGANPGASASHQDSIIFELWLVGFTDGDGHFGISKQGDGIYTKWGLIFKLTQSRYNIRVLNYVKKELGVGSITKDGTKAQFFIRDKKSIENILIPIFDKNPLLTTKYFDYVKIKNALSILNNESLTKEEKNLKLLTIKNSPPVLTTASLKPCFTGFKCPTLLGDKENPGNLYISPGWNNANLPLTNVNSINNVMSKSWLVGFIEAEGSFYLTNKDSPNSCRIVHGFGLTQKQDKIVLEAIKILLHINNPVIFKELYNHYILDTTNSRAIENIIIYFYNTMKGIKSLEFRIWARSYAKHKGNYNKLHKIRNMIRELRNNYV